MQEISATTDSLTFNKQKRLSMNLAFFNFFDRDYLNEAQVRVLIVLVRVKPMNT
jgi:hypothetical protein